MNGFFTGVNVFLNGDIWNCLLSTFLIIHQKTFVLTKNIL